MRVVPTIVLKFGGSVLGDELHMRSAVHEIYRWRRRGLHVVAVVSALAGRTDELLAKCARLYRRRSPETEAVVAATGEFESAALLGLHLNRAGLSATVLTPASIGFRATGSALNASPVELDREKIVRALNRSGVVVLPGYVAMGSMGETVVLGRGGSDLTALYVAHALDDCRCRLIKDVQGLYDRDPDREGARANLYELATYEDALATDGSILQHKAVRFARDVGLSFEVSRLGGRAHSTIGSFKTRFRTTLEQSRPLRVALLGHGTVGAGVFNLLQQQRSRFEIVCVTVRAPSKHGALANMGVRIHTDANRAVMEDIDVVIEVMGGTSVACYAVEAALKRGVHVVTANKALLAEHGDTLAALARTHGASLLASASVGASATVLEALDWNPSAKVKSVRAVLNGTANYVLNAVARGVPFDASVSKAQALGFAELDPSRDLDGLDAADKLRVLARALHLDVPTVVSIPRDPLCDGLASACALEQTLRQVATLERRGTKAHCAVRIEPVTSDDPLACLADEENAAVITWNDGTRRIVRGAGAGRWPTAESVVGDLMDLARQRGADLHEEVALRLPLVV